MMKRQIVLIVHDIRSCHNVGALLRTADCLGAEQVWLTGYTPYPAVTADQRLPHLAAKIGRQIAKTALGAEESVDWCQANDIEPVLTQLQADGYRLVALEQATGSINLRDYQSPTKVALLIGREVEGIAPDLLAQMDDVIEIPMLGCKESLNVVQATAITLWQLGTANS